MSCNERMTMNTWETSALEARNGFMDMMMKRNDKHCTGNVLSCYAPKKHAKCAQTWKQWWSLFSITAALFIMNSLHQARPLIKIFIWSSVMCKGWGMKTDQKCGTSITTHHLTQLCWLESSWPNTRFLSSRLLLFIRPVPSRLFLYFSH
jgi:hypothetical protein